MGPFQKRPPSNSSCCCLQSKKVLLASSPHPPTSREKGKKRKIITTQKSLFVISALGVYVRMTNVSRPDFCPRAVKRGAMPPENLGHWFWAAGTCPIVNRGTSNPLCNIRRDLFWEKSKKADIILTDCASEINICVKFFSNLSKLANVEVIATQNHLSSKTCPILLPSKPAQNHPAKLIITETGTENGHNRQKKRRKPN